MEVDQSHIGCQHLYKRFEKLGSARIGLLSDETRGDERESSTCRPSSDVDGERQRPSCPFLEQIHDDSCNQDRKNLLLRTICLKRFALINELTISSDCRQSTS